MIGSLILFLFGPVLRTVQVSSLCITIHFQNAHLLVSHVTIECWDDVNKNKKGEPFCSKKTKLTQREKTSDDSIVVMMTRLLFSCFT